jgi:lipopolysaccharide transport system ATP-binding protein
MGRNTRLDQCSLGAVVGEGCVEFAIDHMPLLQGSYLLTVSAHEWNGTTMYDYHDRHYEFRVFPSNPEDNHGVFLMDTRWRHLTAASSQETSPTPLRHDEQLAQPIAARPGTSHTDR